MKTIITLDVGGTAIKGNVHSEKGFLYPNAFSFPSLSDKGREEILCHFCLILETLRKKAKVETVDTVLMAFPGPFDYVQGIPLLKGVSKFESIYGIDMKQEITARMQGDGFRKSEYMFISDLDAFALGVIEDRKELRDGKVLFVTIGTGTGSAFTIDGDVRKKGDGIPQNGWIYNLPYHSSILDDFISARGLETLAEKIIGKRMTGIELFQRATDRDAAVLEIFERFGEEIAEGLSPVIQAFRPKVLVFGGNITKAHVFFGAALYRKLANGNMEILYREDTSTAACKGLLMEYRRHHDIPL